MKSMKKSPKSITKTEISAALAKKTGLEPKAVTDIVDGLVGLATVEVKKTGKFTIPGLIMLKTRIKPARKAGTSFAFGKKIKVKARKAKNIVKAYCVAALKKSV